MTLPYLERGLHRAERTAIRDAAGSWTYGELAAQAGRAAGSLTLQAGERVGLMLGRSREAVAVFLGVLEARGVAVPFSLRGTAREFAHQISDAGITRIVTEPAFEAVISDAVAQAGGPAPRMTAMRDLLAGAPRAAPAPGMDAAAVILYTSGTTGKPKGVVHTHASLTAQVDVLHRAWEWSEEDRLLHILPLHHVHGLVNGLLGALWAGAELRLVEKFEAARVWSAFAADEATVFYAVPTIYHQLAEAWEKQDSQTRRRWAEGAGRLRLAVSGSAALPAPLWSRWRDLTGQALLERYGMTEIGMAISNPYRGERRPGTVGQPLPGMTVRIVTEEGRDVSPGDSGEIWVEGPTLFKEYWGKPEATRETFTDGWFRTGDVAQVVDGYVRIVGRASVDILKSAGYKLSALEIEEVLAGHPAIGEVAVVGIPDPEWGEVVTACVIARPGQSLALDSLRDWCKDKLAAYKVPRRLVLRDALPRNAMGKVMKPDLIRDLSRFEDR